MQNTNTDEILNSIESGNVDNALRNLTPSLMQSMSPQPTKRKSKPWFDSECYITRNLVLEKLNELKMTNINNENLRLSYMHTRARYNSLLKAKKQQYTQTKEEELLREAETKPYRVLEPRRTKTTPSIPMPVWENHFENLFQKKSSNYCIEGRTPLTEDERITEDEVWQAIERSKPRKAAGPDNISNELMKGALACTVKLWTALYNKCLEIMDVPAIWRESTVKVVYKGKGQHNTPDSYRGIALECAPFKILNKIILKKIHDSIMTVIPREQHGFIPGRSTTQAVEHVLKFVSEALSKPKGHAYAAFVDYKQAFDGVNRNRVLEKLHPVLGPESSLTFLGYTYHTKEFIL